MTPVQPNVVLPDVAATNTLLPTPGGPVGFVPAAQAQPPQGGAQPLFKALPGLVVMDPALMHKPQFQRIVLHPAAGKSGDKKEDKEEDKKD